MSTRATALRQALPVNETDSTAGRLLDAAKAGDEGAFEQLLKLHRTPVYRLALGMLGNPDEAADVCQDVFIRFYRSLRRLKAERGIRAWLRRVTVNRCYDMLKARNRRKETLLETEEARLVTDDEQNRYLLSHEMAKGLGALSPRERAALVLTYQQGYSSIEAGKAMQCRPATVRVLLLKAREKLRRLFGVESGGGQR